MKHISAASLRKRRWIAWGVLVISALSAILLIFSPAVFPPPTYDELLEKEVVVSSFEQVYQRFGTSYRLYTENDGTFAISGEVDYNTAVDALQRGVTATVKWHSSPNPFSECAEEVSVDGNVIIRYNNSNSVNRVSLILWSAVIVLCGAGYTTFSLFWLRRLQSFEEKRTKRNEKKYGKKE